MTRDEQKAITEFIERAVNCCKQTMDVEADAIIRALFVRNPDAAYRITRLAMTLQNEAMDRPDSVYPARSSGRKTWLDAVLKRELPACRLDPVIQGVNFPKK